MSIEVLIRFIHSWTRWGIVLVSILGLIYFAWGWLQSKAWTKQSQTILTVFSSLVGLQWIVGIILLILMGNITGFGIRHYWEHLTVQTIALAVSHMHMSWRKKEMDDKTRYQRGFLLILGVMVLIVVGVMALPSAIQWRFMSI